MLVTAYRDGSHRTGLLIGEANARRYFRKRSLRVDLQLDHLHIQCKLEPDFWNGRPEIHDPRLSLWLEFKAGRGRNGREPMQFAMEPLGAGKFAVQPIASQDYHAFGAEVMLPVRGEAECSMHSERQLRARSVA